MNITRTQAKLITDTFFVSWMKGSLSKEQRIFCAELWIAFPGLRQEWVSEGLQEE